MKRALAAIVLCFVMLACLGPAVALAADPDFWGVDASRQNIGPSDVWQPTDDGYTDGMGYFPDLGLMVWFLFGKHAFGW